LAASTSAILNIHFPFGRFDCAACSLAGAENHHFRQIVSFAYLTLMLSKCFQLIAIAFFWM